MAAMSIQIAVPKEERDGERRVALTPDMGRRLLGSGHAVVMEAGAGEAAGFPDADYKSAGVKVVADGAGLLKEADITLQVNPLSDKRIAHLKQGSVLIGFMAPHAAKARLPRLAEGGVSAFAMELIPRISRAQAMDALSSQAAVAGYRAVLDAANLLGKFFPMLTTAAGTVRPSKVLVIGAGVAGLQAIATARRLGAMVEGYDVRAAVKEQVESLGAKFVDTGVAAEGAGGYARELTADEKQQQQEALGRHVAAADAVICTAALPGRAAPRIIDKTMAESMAAGSVIVDLAAESGGNCELTKCGKTIVHSGITVHGPENPPAQVAKHASELYARNLMSFLDLLIRDGQVQIDLDDEIIRESLLTHAGEVRYGSAS